MITHTPRADPNVSASPSTSRQTLSQPRTPITPNRYRAAPSTAQPLPWTPSSRRSSVVDDDAAEHDSAAQSSSSNWQASIELSLTTRRRLIRKPLPQIPPSQLNRAGAPDDADEALIDSAALDARYNDAGAWWPDALPDKHVPAAASSSSSARPSSSTQSPSSTDGQGLDEQSLRHLLTILHYAALRYESDAVVEYDDGTIGRNVVVSATGTYKKQTSSTNTPVAASAPADYDKEATYVLDEATLDSLYLALQAAFRHLSLKHVLGDLQRTASIRWRAEAQLRNATAAQAAESSSFLSSRWARFAWPAAALGKAYKEAQRNVLPPPPGESAFSGLASPSYLQMSHEQHDGLYGDLDHRIRKRDVAVKILSNAVWFVRNYGPVAGVEALEESSQHSDKTVKTATLAADQLAPPIPSLSSSRRTSENLLKRNAGLPNLLSKSSATTAISGTATPESGQSDAPPTPASEASSERMSAMPVAPTSVRDAGKLPASSSGQQLLPRSTSTTASGLSQTETASGTESRLTPSSATATHPVPASTNVSAGEKSKAMEHLTSLSAAAGAAMRQRAQHAAAVAAATGTRPEDSVDAVLAASARLRPQFSRPSLRSFAGRSEAEIAETDALEKAERDHLVKIGRGCDEWAKMVVCRLCASISVAESSGKQSHRRSGTITARDLGRAAVAAEAADVGSSISTRSDMTAKAGRVGHNPSQGDEQGVAEGEADNQKLASIVWQAGVYKGEELFAQGGASSNDRRGSVSPDDVDERVRLVGGSFVCSVQTEKQKQALVELLEIALYAGMSMLLESSFLSDSDAARPKIVKVPTRTTSTVDAPQRGTSLVQQPTLSRSSSQQSLQSSHRSISGTTGTMQTSDHTHSAAQADNGAHEADAAHRSGPRKWTKGLWGKLGQQPLGSSESNANLSAGRPGTSEGHGTATIAPRTSLTMHRYHTDDDASTVMSTAARTSIFKAGEEPKQTIAARKAALFASATNSSSPSTPSGPRGQTAEHAAHAGHKPHRLVGRLMNAFAKPSSSEPLRTEAVGVGSGSDPNTALVPSKTYASNGAHLDTSSRAEVAASRSRASTIENGTSNFERLRARAKATSLFPVERPSPAALSTSPELSMLLCYQYRPAPNQTVFPTAAYLTAFHRLQLLRFLADQRRDHLTFASPSHGISPSGDLVPFVGVQTPSSSSSPWSVILSRGQHQQQIQLKSRNGVRSAQLLSYELLSGDGSALGLCREEVAFYQRLSDNRDVPLGQVIEELGIRACALEADNDAASKAAQDSRIVAGKSHISGAKDRNDASARPRNSAYDAPEQRLQFIHGSCRIKLVATVLPTRLYSTEIEDGMQHEAESRAQPTAGSAAVSPSLKPTRSRESDVSAIAAASHTDKEVADTAFAVAETAVQAAETGASRPLVDQRGSGSTSGIWMWNASAKSGWQAKATPMSESTYLLSFARYLEAISYHPALRRAAGLEPASAKGYGGLAKVQQQLRQGKGEDSRSVAEGPNLLRFFRSGRSLVKVQVQPLVLFDLQLEGPYLKTSNERRRERKQKQAQAEKRRLKQIADSTRLEIQRFFASVKGTTTKLEDVFVSRDLDESGKTIRRKSAAQHAEKGQTNVTGLPSASSNSALPDQVAEPMNLLTSLRSSLRSDEFELYESLQRTSHLDGVNDVRKAFADRAKSAKNRLTAWIKKHLDKKEQANFENPLYDEPEYFQAGRRAFPGSSFIIRDDEPLSIIAYSLSSCDFRAEMGTLAQRHAETTGYMGSSNEEHVRQWRSGVVDGSDAASDGSYISRSGASTASAASSLLRDRVMRKVPMDQLDPDKDEVFYDAEPVRAVLKRKKRGRESSILSLTLRRVGSTLSESQRASYQAMNANGRPASSAGSIRVRDDDEDDDDNDDEVEVRTDGRSSTISTSIDGQDTTLGALRTPSRRPPAGMTDQKTPSSAKADSRTHGSVTALRRTFELRSQSSFSSIPDRKSSIQPAGASTISNTSTDATFHAQITPMSGRPASLASIFSSNKTDSEAADSHFSRVSGRTNGSSVPTAVPRSASKPRRPSSSLASEVSSREENAETSTGAPFAAKNSNPTQPSLASEGVAGADSQSLLSNSTLPGSTATESPHIKHNLVQGSTKISCVTWFAEEFAALRERWGVEHDYIHSLSRCQPWVASGGKSKSAFFKTADERFIAKQLLTVWSIDEKEAFLEFAPAYIRYMMNSAVNDCPTLLVKIAGVYSIKIKDIKAGETKLKMTVMVLENLWAGDGGKSIRFDLKGIRDRKVKLSAQQQQDMQQAATNAAASGQPLVEVAGGEKGSTIQGSATTAMSAGVASMATGRGDQGDSGATVSSSAQAPMGSGDAKQSSGSNAVWWDSEWIERYRHRAFVPETQKELFLRALQNDTQFLTASNVMDYSLLLGVMERPVRQDDMYPPAAPPPSSGTTTPHATNSEAADLHEQPERPSFRCRIVDFLGAFTLAKQLESSSKKALKGQDAKGNVTILPPSEYASRFLGAMDTYFIGTPCQPRLDAGYGFDRMCEEAARGNGEGEEVRRPRLASVL
ncbi:PIPK domain-containing protein [Pseudozyma hubeiensis]|nr:PIPK domain-containing protein [Pseudozyma hubeiensis]